MCALVNDNVPTPNLSLSTFLPCIMSKLWRMKPHSPTTSKAYKVLFFVASELYIKVGEPENEADLMILRLAPINTQISKMQLLLQLLYTTLLMYTLKYLWKNIHSVWFPIETDIAAWALHRLCCNLHHQAVKVTYMNEERLCWIKESIELIDHKVSYSSIS